MSAPSRLFPEVISDVTTDCRGGRALANPLHGPLYPASLLRRCYSHVLREVLFVHQGWMHVEITYHAPCSVRSPYTCISACKNRIPSCPAL